MRENNSMSCFLSAMSCFLLSDAVCVGVGYTAATVRLVCGSKTGCSDYLANSYLMPYANHTMFPSANTI